MEGFGCRHIAEPADNLVQLDAHALQLDRDVAPLIEHRYKLRVGEPLHHATPDLSEAGHLIPRGERARGRCVAKATHDASHLRPHILLLRRVDAPLVDHSQQQPVAELLHDAAADLHPTSHLDPFVESRGHRSILHSEHGLLTNCTLRLLLRDGVDPS